MTPAPFHSPDQHPRHRIAVLDSEMSYVDTRQGDPIVFLQGNPASSYLQEDSPDAIGTALQDFVRRVRA